MLVISLTTHLAALPTEWGSVTLAQAAQLATLGDEATMQACLAVLLDCSPEELLQLAPKHLRRALSALLFLSEPVPDLTSFERPTSILLGDVEVPILSTLEELTFGQAADIGALIQEHANNVAQLRIPVLATILQPAYDGSGYDSDKALELEQLCGTVKLRHALPLTDFFLPSSTASVAATPPT
ncbi:hypothetical protein [Hymenobacter sp. AT01-02]|uniref:hypothetical protein n=1 Tax=Hymenobacter sp. AT01-02 TaxID=1571877 RepID=UPI0005F1E723|nr:hypothetical protein [Hymenobacter sp. AT01-02]